MLCSHGSSIELFYGPCFLIFVCLIILFRCSFGFSILFFHLAGIRNFKFCEGSGRNVPGHSKRARMCLACRAEGRIFIVKKITNVAQSLKMEEEGWSTLS